MALLLLQSALNLEVQFLTWFKLTVSIVRCGWRPLQAASLRGVPMMCQHPLRCIMDSACGLIELVSHLRCSAMRGFDSFRKTSALPSRM